MGQDDIVANYGLVLTIRLVYMIVMYMNIIHYCKHEVMLKDVMAKLLPHAWKGLQTRILKVVFYLRIQ